MNSIYILIPIALIFTAIAIRAFFWAVDNKQYDDLDAAGQSILFDDDTLTTKSSVKSKEERSD
jgi:cbb3-type cytochrome oxidase maturation protein